MHNWLVAEVFEIKRSIGKISIFGLGAELDTINDLFFLIIFIFTTAWFICRDIFNYLFCWFFHQIISVHLDWHNLRVHHRISYSWWQQAKSKKALPKSFSVNSLLFPEISPFLKQFFIFTAWKVSIFGVILVRIFSHLDLYGDILRIWLYSVRMRENTDQNNSDYGHFLSSDIFRILIF